MSTYSVEAILRAVDQGFSSTLASAQKQLSAFQKSSQTGSEVLGKMSDGMIKAGKFMTTGFTAPLAAGVTAAVKGFGNLEQSLGGVETMFKKNGISVRDLQKDYGMTRAEAQKFYNTMSTEGANVITNAQQAYKTAGMSANDYMEQVTSFSASLLQGLGGDTVEAAKYADKAITDMADNANKFGTDMGRITDAYQGFAKQNYTMLDNLKLGYGGTKSEMERLIADANRVKEANGEMANLSIENFADVVEAIHTMQEEMGVTGTTADEAAGTINGSFNQMRAAAKNFIDGLGETTFDSRQQLIELGESVEVFGQNLGRTLKNIWDAFPLSDIQKSAILAAASLGPLSLGFGHVGKAMAGVWRATGKMAGGIVNFAGSTKTAFGTLGKGIAGFGSQIGGIVNTAFPQLKSGFETVAIKGMYAWDGIKAGASNMVAGVGGKLSIFQATMGSTFSRIGAFGGQMTSVLGQSFGLMSGIIQNFAGVAMSALMPAAIFGVFLVGLGLLVSQFGQQIWQMANIAISQGPTIIDNLVQGIVSRIPLLITQGTLLVAKFAEVIVANAPSVIQGAVALIQALVQGVGANAGNLIGAAVRVIGVFVDGILSALPQLLATGMQFLVQLAQGVVQNIPLILSTALQIVQNFVQSVVSAAPAILAAGVQLVVTLVTGLIQNLPQIVLTGVQMITAFIKGLVQVIPLVAAAGLMLVVKLVVAIISGVPQIVEAAKTLITGFFTALWEGITTFGETIVSGITSLWDMVTGKTSEGTAQAKVSVDDMANHTTAKTAEMQANAGANVDAMSTDLLAKFMATNTGGSTEMDALLASVTGSTQGVAQAGAEGTQSFLDSVTGNLSTATAAGTAEAQALANGVNAATSAIDVPTQADMQSYFNAVQSNTSQANATATAESHAMQAGVNEATAQIGTGVQETMNQYSQTVTTAMTEANTTAVTEATTMATGVNEAFTTMGTGVDAAMSSLTSKVSSGMSQASSTAKSESDAIANAVKSGFDRAKSSVDSSVSSMTSKFTSGMNQVKSTATSTTSQLLSTFKSTFSSLTSATTSMMSSMVSAVQSGMSQVLSVSQSTGSQMIAIFMALQGQMVSAGAFAGQGFASGLASQAGAIMAVAQGIANSVSSTIRAALKIHSPSRLTRELGGYTGEGFYLGLADWEGKVGDMSEILAESAIPDVDSLDLAANLGSMPSSISHDGIVTVSHSPQPLELMLAFGRETFTAFVEDIFDERLRQERYRLRSSSI